MAVGFLSPDTFATGLTLIKSQTIGTAVSSVTVTGAFSATYDNYKILLGGGVGSNNDRVALGLGSSASNYFGGFIKSSQTGASLTAIGDSGSSKFSYVAGYHLTGINGDINLISPFLTKETWITAFTKYDGSFGTYSGFQTLTASYTDFTLEFASGTMTGGTVRVYGYQNS